MVKAELLNIKFMLSLGSSRTSGVYRLPRTTRSQSNTPFLIIILITDCILYHIVASSECNYRNTAINRIDEDKERIYLNVQIISVCCLGS